MKLFFLNILLACSCVAGAQSLIGTSWTLMEIRDERGSNILEDTLKRATLTFKSESQYRGDGLCNGHFGNYTVNNESLTMEQPASTKKFCPGSYGELESKLYNWYKNTERYTLSGDQLYLYSGKMKLVYRKK